MSPIEIGYLALVLVAFCGFAVTLAYYNHHAIWSAPAFWRCKA